METSEFKELYMEEGLDKELLKKTLQGQVRLTAQGDVLLESSIKPQKKAIALYLLGLKVLKLDKLRESEAAGPSEISKNTGIPEGTVRPQLRVLFEEGYAKQTEDGKYYIPNHLLLKIQSLFAHGGNQHE